MTNEKRIELLRKNNDKLTKQIYELETEKNNLEKILENKADEHYRDNLDRLKQEWEKSISDLQIAKDRYNTLNKRIKKIKNILSDIGRIPFYKRIFFKIHKRMGR